MQIKELLTENYRYLPAVLTKVNGEVEPNTEEFEEETKGICPSCNGSGYDALDPEHTNLCPDCKGTGKISSKVLRSKVAIVRPGTHKFLDQELKKLKLANYDSDQIINPNELGDVRRYFVFFLSKNPDLSKFEKPARTERGSMIKVKEPETNIIRLQGSPDVYYPAIFASEIKRSIEDLIEVIEYAQAKNRENREKKLPENVGIAVEDF